MAQRYINKLPNDIIFWKWRHVLWWHFFHS